MKIDLTGQRFGKWTVIERKSNGKGKNARWLCRCDCGRESLVYRANLGGISVSECAECHAVTRSEWVAQRVVAKMEANRPTQRIAAKKEANRLSLSRLERIAELRIPRTEPYGPVTVAKLESMRLEALEFHMERAGLTLSPGEGAL